MKVEEIEAFLDKRSTEDLLAGLPHIHPNDISTNWWLSPRCYPFYAGMGRLIKPESVLEIGVRLGYSLISLYRGYSGITRITGIDAEYYIKGSQSLALENLKSLGIRAKIELPIRDSADVDFDEEAYDLVHIDGDHSFSGCLTDIQRTWKAICPGGVLLVDDADYIPDVRNAIEEAKLELPSLDHSLFFSSYRGCWIGVKR